MVFADFQNKVSIYVRYIYIYILGQHIYANQLKTKTNQLTWFKLWTTFFK